MKSDSRLPGPRYLLKLYKHAAHLLNPLRLGFFAGMERAVLSPKLLCRVASHPKSVFVLHPHLSPKYRGIRRRCQSRKATPWPTRSTCDSSSASYFRRCLTSTRIEGLGKRQAAPSTKEQFEDRDTVMSPIPRSTRKQ